jgi:hypothetical protein
MTMMNENGNTWNKHNDLKNVRLGLFFKDLAHWTAASCVGLNVAGYTTAKYLRTHGIHAEVFPVRNNIDVVNSIDKYKEIHGHSLTHVVISAPWMSLWDIRNLIAHFPHIKFVVLSHSNVGFLQADPRGVELYRKYSELSKQYPNFKVGGNSRQFCDWFNISYKENCIWLPNIYPTERIKSKVWDGIPPLKIGSFGAIRPEKNFMTAAAAAMVIHSILDVPVELHMSTGGDGCKSTTLPSIIEMTENVKGFTLIRHHWETWNKFIELIKKMDIMIQVSYTESFNMVTADGISVGVPSVVSPVIWWVPDEWKANPDDAVDVARVGLNILQNDQGYKGADALLHHDKVSFENWKNFLQFGHHKIK